MTRQSYAMPPVTQLIIFTYRGSPRLSLSLKHSLGMLFKQCCKVALNALSGSSA
jgi:hypothetical protein